LNENGPLQGGGQNLFSLSVKIGEKRKEERKKKKKKKEKKKKGEKREKKTANDGPPRPKGRVPSSELVKLVIVVLVSLSNDLLRVYLV